VLLRRPQTGLFQLAPAPPVQPPPPTRRSTDLTPASRCARVSAPVPRWSSPRPQTLGPSSSRSFIPVLLVEAHRLGRLEPRCAPRSEEHTSELQSRENLVCRRLLEKTNLYYRRV